MIGPADSNISISLTGVVVLITIGWLTTLYAWRQERFRQQQAWQWWHQQQAIQSHSTAESIRDGLLQQTFGFRRYIEGIEKGAEEQWLTRFQTFHRSLETLSDKLSPPFISESLPLALQFALKNWQLTQLDSNAPQALSNIQFNLPTQWAGSNLHQNRSILSIVTVLLDLLIRPDNISSPLNVTLKRENNSNFLALELINDSDQPIEKVLELTEIEYLKEIFHSLTTGQLEISKDDSSLIVHLRWPANLASSGDRHSK